MNHMSKSWPSWLIVKTADKLMQTWPLISFCLYIFPHWKALSPMFIPSEVLCKWSLLQARWSSVSDDRWRSPGQSRLDAARDLAHLCRETRSTLLAAGTSLLWKESPDQVHLILMIPLNEGVFTPELFWSVCSNSGAFTCSVCLGWQMTTMPRGTN